MVKISFICEHCREEFLIEDFDKLNNNNFYSLRIDFSNKIIEAYCPECEKYSVLNLGNIQKAIEEKTKLPRIGKVNF